MSTIKIVVVVVVSIGSEAGLYKRVGKTSHGDITVWHSKREVIILSSGIDHVVNEVHVQLSPEHLYKMS